MGLTRRRGWLVITTATLGLLVVIELSDDTDTPADRALTTDETRVATPDPAAAARAKAGQLVANRRYLRAVTVLEAEGLDGAADRVARRGSQSLIRRARRALDAGRFTEARSIASAARDLHPSGAAGALIADAQAAAVLARDRRTCTPAEKNVVRAGGGVPPGCATFSANLAAREAEEAAQAAAARCDPNYEGACLKPDSPDYDCAGGSGDGPDYTGTVRVVGADPYDLDRDGDGIACDA